jgi:L-rhamnose mutarotase
MLFFTEIARMQRYGAVIRLQPGAEEKYRYHHAHPWPEVNEMIRKCNIRNYTIFLHNGTLFGYYEYHGTDHAADMAKMAADPKTQEWWAIMEPLQHPLDTRRPGEWWAAMDEVYHLD